MHRLYGMFGVRVGRLFGAVVAAGFAVTLLAGLAGCKSQGSATSSPRAAARAFVTAMNNGDAENIAAVSTGDAESLKLLVTMSKLNAAYAGLETLSAQKFGDPHSVFAYPRARDHYAVMAREIDTAPETSDGQTATIGKGLGAIHVKKSGDAWLVDRSMHVPPGGDPSALAMSEALTAAYSEVADGIRSGSLASAEEAKAMLMGRTQQAVLQQMGTPSTSPSTGPATSRPMTGMRDSLLQVATQPATRPASAPTP